MSKKRSLTEICTPCRFSNQLIWCGGDIPELGIKDGDNYITVVNLINQAIQNGGGGSAYVEKTFSELNTMKNTNALVPHTMYLMTDFATIYDRPDFVESGGIINIKPSLTTVTAITQPIVLMAISTNEFAQEVFMPSRPNDKYLYDIDIQKTHLTQSPCKGTIYECIDENNNRTGYNHPVIEFKRYNCMSDSKYLALIDDGTSTDVAYYTTFEDTCRGNWLSDASMSINNLDTGIYSVEINKGFPVNVIFDRNCYNNNLVFNPSIHKNISGGVITNFIVYGFGNSFSSNCMDNSVIGGSINWNVFYDFFERNVIYNTFDDNITYNKVSHNIFNSPFLKNIVCPYFKENTIKTNLYSVDFTLATHVKQSYTCDIVEVQGGTKKLNYQDATGALVVSDITD